MGKRLLDIIIASLVLILTAPLLLVAAIGILVFSPGPVFYMARRAGLKGRPYRMYKLRTMHVHKEGEGPLVTGPDDPRIFTFGKILRLTKIDELPQFINVLNNTMSVVGPRPEDPEIVEKYYTPEQKKTLRVKPGVTSPASIYFSSESDARIDQNDVMNSYVQNVLEDKLNIELDYIRNASLKTDMKIIWDTFLYVVKVMFKVVAVRVYKKHTPG